ncbi:MAG: DUF488 family protein [Prolixibacteraceae bacterium]
MMYYRRKIVLALLQKASKDGRMNATKLQKLLFLLTRSQAKKSYDFVPYKYGCYSLQAAYDLGALEKKELVKKESHNSTTYWRIISAEDFEAQLKREDRFILKGILNKFGTYSTKDLISYTYIHYPFWAVNSTVKKEMVPEEDLKFIEQQKRKIEQTELLTIGYEGISLENYINKLILNDVRLLCDVRKNPLSKKYGFSKSQLKNACNGVGIEYIHIPELGIVSERRQNLKNPSDYRKLFDEYEASTLNQHKEQLNSVEQLLSRYQRVALTCFEKEPVLCHRKRITDVLQKSPQWQIPVKHL